MKTVESALEVIWDRRAGQGSTQRPRSVSDWS